MTAILKITAEILDFLGGMPFGIIQNHTDFQSTVRIIIRIIRLITSIRNKTHKISPNIVVINPEPCCYQQSHFVFLLNNFYL